MSARTKNLRFLFIFIFFSRCQVYRKQTNKQNKEKLFFLWFFYFYFIYLSCVYFYKSEIIGLGFFSKTANVMFNTTGDGRKAEFLPTTLLLSSFVRNFSGGWDFPGIFGTCGFAGMSTTDLWMSKVESIGPFVSGEFKKSSKNERGHRSSRG